MSFVPEYFSPPLSALLAIGAATALPLVFLFLGRLAPRISSIVLRLGLSYLIACVAWLAPLSSLGGIPDLISTVSALSTIAISAFAVHIFASVLAYSFRLETFLAVERTAGISRDKLAEEFGGGKGLHQVFLGRVRTLQLLSLASESPAGEMRVTPSGKLLATVYRSIRRLIRMDSEPTT